MPKSFPVPSIRMLLAAHVEGANDCHRLWRPDVVRRSALWQAGRGRSTRKRQASPRPFQQPAGQHSWRWCVARSERRNGMPIQREIDVLTRAIDVEPRK
jgi:hypothetical protein